MPLRAGQLYLRAAESSELGQWDETKQVRVHPWFGDLYSALIRYPAIVHDDLLDCLEMAVWLALKPNNDDFWASYDETGGITAFGQPLTGLPPFYRELVAAGVLQSHMTPPNYDGWG
jgi:hypothetical protein